MDIIMKKKIVIPNNFYEALILDPNNTKKNHIISKTFKNVLLYIITLLSEIIKM
jgi:hypothetical protein